MQRNTTLSGTKWFVIAIMLLSMPMSMPSSADSGAETPEMLFAEVRRLCETLPSPRDTHGATRQELFTMAARIAACDAALPGVIAVLSTTNDYHNCYTETLMTALSMSKNAKATEALVSLALVRPKLEELHHTLSERRITCSIPDVAYEELVSGILRPDGRIGIFYARILGHCEALPVSKRVAPLFAAMTRYASMHQPIPLDVSAREYIRRDTTGGNLLLAFHNIGETAIPAISAEAEKATDERLKKWLTLARGAAGDAAVADELKQMLLNDEDITIRVAAAGSYAHALKRQSIPFLKTVAAEDKFIGWQEVLAIYPLRLEILGVLLEYDEDFVGQFQRDHPSEGPDDVKEALKRE